MNAPQLYALLNSLMPVRHGLRRRKVPRVGLNYRVTIVPCTFGDDGQRAITAWLRDISPRGLSVLAKTRLKHHDYFLLLLPRPGTNSLNIICRVEAVLNVPGSGARLGARFIGVYNTHLPKGKQVRRFRVDVLAKKAA